MLGAACNGYMLAPPKDERCVWMAAGVLTYKLCNRDFECENCKLHVALAEGGKPHSKPRTPTKDFIESPH